MAGEGPRYISEEDAYGGMLKNLISPPDDQQGIADPQQVASTLPPTPADEPRNPTLKTRPQPAAPVRQAAPIQAAPSQPAAPAAVPASVTPNGGQQGPQKTWADYVRAGLDRGTQAADASQAAVTAIQNQPSAEQQNADLIAKRAGISGNPPNPNAPEYKPGIGTRIARGIDAFRRGGVLGVVDPADTGGKAYGAPNRQYDIDTARKAAQVGSIDKNISQNIDDQKADTERQKALATEARANATTSLDIGKTATGQENAESNAEKTKLQGDLNDVKQQLADQKGNPTNYEQTVVAAALEKDPARKAALTGAAKTMAATEAKKFQYQARAQGDPFDERRQTMIDAATADVQKLNDFQWDQDLNDGKGGFYDPASPNKVYTPEEFTDAKNKISTKLDKDLAAKKLRPLGVRFTVKGTTPGGAQPAAAPQAAPAAPAAPKQAEPKTVAEVQAGQVYHGHKYLGGDKADKKNWQQVSQ